MTETKEPKVTECWTWEQESGAPHVDATLAPSFGARQAIILWREDYDALRRELEKLREYKKWHEMYKKMTAEAEAKEREHRKRLAVCKTWEQG